MKSSHQFDEFELSIEEIKAKFIKREKEREIERERKKERERERKNEKFDTKNSRAET